MNRYARPAWIGLFALAAPAAFAQLTVTSIGSLRTYTNATELNYTENHLTAFAASSLTLISSAHYAFQPDRLETVAFSNLSVRFSVQIGDFPVALTDLIARYNGKSVFAMADPTDSLFGFGRWSLYEVDDVNNSGFWDPGEGTIFIDNFADTFFTSFFGEGINNYNDTLILTETFLFGPNTVYMFDQSTLMQTEYTIGVGEPSISVTQENHVPTFNGHTLTFSHEPVPEPATLAVLGLGILPFLRRRKKRA